MDALLIVFFIFIAVGMIAHYYLIALGKAAKIAKPSNEMNPIIEARVGNILGKYKDHDIYEQVKLKDGRTFVYESAAVECEPGVYLANHCEKSYVIIDKCLLYREAN